MNYKLKIISHACVFIDMGEVKLLTDPWLFGECFNNGWSLKRSNLLKENISQKEINSITHIYISHEHPDHFHVPSLKSLISRSKRLSNAEIICKNDIRTEKDILKVLKKCGYKRIKLLNHLKSYSLSKDISIRIYHHRHIDSALLIFSQNKPFLINLNDCEIYRDESNLIRKRFGKFPILLNQFSIAGFNGIDSKDLILKEKQIILNKMIEQHISLGASTTIPFASFCWFSNSDNKFLNQYHNSLEEVSNKFKENKLNLYCLEPPSDYIETKKLINKSKNPSTKLIEVESQAALESIKTSLIIKTIRKRISSLISFSNRFIFYLLERNIIFFIKDNSTYLNVDFRRIEIKEIDVTDQDNLSYMEINSQPLYFAFANSFGIQTLGVSGRYKFINYKKIPKVWKFIRIISSLDNNKTPLRFRTIFNQFFYKAIFSRRTSFMIQLKQQLSRFGNF